MSENTVDAETQAQMALKLRDDVQKLIREEILKAFNDYRFLQELFRSYGLNEALVIELTHSSRFKDFLLDYIKQNIPNHTHAVQYYSTTSTGTHTS